MAHFLVLHGPNLNLLGQREPEVYGQTTLAEINVNLSEYAIHLGHELTHLQSNAEHELINAVQSASTHYQMIIVNPGAYTHTSIALRDAFLATRMPFVEVHLSNVHAREPFRQHSYLSDIAVGVITGFGPLSYRLALDAAIAYSESKTI